MIRLYFLVFTLLAMQVAVSWAGQQREEHLADSVRTAMGTAVTGLTPPQPFLATPADKQVYAQWLQRNLQTLNARLRQIHGNAGLPELATPELQTMFLQTVWYESSRAALDPSLVLGLMEVESGFRKYAVSGAGAMGVMQVMPFWPRLLTQGDAVSMAGEYAIWLCHIATLSEDRKRRCIHGAGPLQRCAGPACLPECGDGCTETLAALNR